MLNTFQLPIVGPDIKENLISIGTGDKLFVLGANGTGKSTLMHRFFAKNRERAYRILAHRQTWFQRNNVDMTAANRRELESRLLSSDQNLDSRWLDHYGEQRTGMALYDLIYAENFQAREIAEAVRQKNIEKAAEIAKQDSPVTQINQILKQSNIPIEIAVRNYEEILSRKNGGPEYSIARLSDGERSALLIVAAVLTVRPNTLLLIDEPERHLHRSIISPLLTELFRRRPDCAFVVSTHDVMLPIDNPDTRTLLIRSCEYADENPRFWDYDVAPLGSSVPEDLKRDLLGARRRVLFVEGNEQSLDKQLYALLFPDVSVIPRNSCKEVERAVVGVRGSETAHWVQAWGIVDNDRRAVAETDKLKSQCVFVLPVFSVESLYYHPEVQRRVCEKFSTVTGSNVSKAMEEARNAAFEKIAPQAEMMGRRVAEAKARETIFQNMPTSASVAQGIPVNIQIDVAKLVAGEKSTFEAAVSKGDLNEVIAHYPIRETPMIEAIIKKLGFLSRDQYEQSVRKMLVDDPEALKVVKTFCKEIVDALA